MSDPQFDAFATWYCREFDQLKGIGYTWNEATAELAKKLVFRGRTLIYGSDDKAARYRAADMAVIRPMDGRRRFEVIQRMAIEFGISHHGARHRLNECIAAKLVRLDGYWQSAVVRCL